MKKFNIVIMVIAFLSLLVTVGCSDKTDADSKEKIVFADDGWDSLRFHNQIARTIIEEGYGYETEKLSGSTPAIYTAIEEGQVDVHMEIWTKNDEEVYTKGIEEGYFIKLSTNYDDNHQGFYVPTYVIEGDPERGIEPVAPDLKYITDLPEYWELFKDPADPEKGRIIGAISGWNVDKILYDAFKHYGLDENYNYFRAGSETGINISLSEAYNNGEPWIGYNYEPNWVMGKFDMTPILEKEPGPLEKIGAQDIDIISNESLPERAPEVVEFLKNYKTSSKIANDALVYMQEEEASHEDAALKFLKENEDLWTKWVPEDVAAKVKEGIK
ncbi:ABC transporter substrate-binding protein [Virgibacillus litoralis]|uniref:Glycine betaine/proline transport system substrate-binding protein n=1 Tax=Virgibacillus litoralis TaxID=578221 RepID=A0ABS4HBS1_9BACI|nr:ABC transporter substrate-binding protein [Virgibacillus litoralis]MBP1948367.1 glycine betaine/proline transport system substrate-binding protein [Virgibacillus litoralis]